MTSVSTLEELLRAGVPKALLLLSESSLPLLFVPLHKHVLIAVLAGVLGTKRCLVFLFSMQHSSESAKMMAKNTKRIVCLTKKVGS